MSELVLIVPTVPAADRKVLARTLGRARQSSLADGDWRRWVANRLGGPDLAAIPPACVATGSDDAWFATPVHLTAALDHVQMPSRGWLRLDDDEVTKFALDFASVFGASPLTLAAAGAEGFLLSGLAAAGARTHDPARVLGGDIGPWLPTGADTVALRRLGAEIEMWLHEHALNRARDRRGALPVSTLWLWGGGEGTPAPAVSSLPRADWPRGYGDESWLRGLWRCADRQLDGGAKDFAAIDAAAGGDVVAVARFVDEGAVSERWVEPALAHLAAGRLRRLHVLLGERHFCFSRFDLLKPWRRTVSWAAPT